MTVVPKMTTVDPREVDGPLTTIDAAARSVAYFALIHMGAPPEPPLLAELAIHLLHVDHAVSDAVDLGVPLPIAHAHIRDAPALPELMAEMVNSWIAEHTDRAYLYLTSIDGVH